jgi:multidrug efflux pump subunit AcrA (membrane-fusion protein)
MEATARLLAAAGVTLVAAAGVSACGGGAPQAPPALVKVEPIPGTRLEKVVLTALGAERIGIRTGRVRSVPVGRRRETVIPYAAVLYAASGQAFTYTSPAPLTYVRRPIEIDRIDGDRAFLRSGPPAGTLVVTVGEDELLGAEQGVNE